jgi:hypothetical protein
MGNPRIIRNDEQELAAALQGADEARAFALQDAEDHAGRLLPAREGPAAGNVPPHQDAVAI